MTTTNARMGNPFSAVSTEEPLEDWERELLGAGMPAPVDGRVWTVESTATTAHVARGGNVARMTVDLGEDTPTPKADRHWIRTLPAGKAHRARHAPRLTDGIKHPVTVRKIGA